MIAELILALTLAQAGSPATRCADHAELVAVLTGRWRERVVASGVSTAGARVELWASEDGGSWTILHVLPSGRACAVLMGRSWEPERAPPHARDAAH